MISRDFKSSSVRLTTHQCAEKTVFVLEVAKDLYIDFTVALQETVQSSQQNKEAKIVFTKDHTIYFKQREGVIASKLTVAKPSLGSCVASCILNENHFNTFLKKLLSFSKHIKLSELGDVSHIQNFDFEITLIE